MRTCMIAQPAGIGDILFVQKIVRHHADLGFKVVMPIVDYLSWIRYYIEPYPNVEFPLLSTKTTPWTGDFPLADTFMNLLLACSATNEPQNAVFKTPVLYKQPNEADSFVFLALGPSYLWLNEKMMTSKYTFAGLDHSDWADYIHLKRRMHVERELFYDVLGLKDGERYTLTNEQNSRGSVPFSVPGKVVKLQMIDGFTLFDWSLVIERASQIVTIDTSLVLLTEILKPKIPLTMISRYTPPTFEPVKDILKLNWNLVPTVEELRVEAA